ncbi:MAG: septum formation initiator family protein [Oscillospiraceae bacterium]|nr:septum formation initiator family protein [Oscillospiraceae bacterium]
MRRLKPSHITVYMLIAFLMVAILGITAMQGSLAKTSRENAILSEEISRLEQENLELEYKLSILGTDEAVEQLARERLHWVYDQELVYIDTGSN